MNNIIHTVHNYRYTKLYKLYIISIIITYYIQLHNTIIEQYYDYITIHTTQEVQLLYNYTAYSA